MNLELYPDSTSRVIYCGDLHGEIDFLLHSLEDIRFDYQTDLLIATGDLVDRGTDSIKTVEYFLEHENFYTVIGNHEDMMRYAITVGFGMMDWMNNGGGWSESVDRAVLTNLVSRINFPYTISVRHQNRWVGVTHAGLPYELTDWDDMCRRVESKDMKTIESITWDRELISTPEWYKRHPVTGVDWVVCGHTPVEDPIQIANRLYIDTGACFRDGKLTLLEFVEGLPTYKHFEK